MGRRRTLTAMVIGLAFGLGWGLRAADPAPPDPLLTASRSQSLATAAATADEALARLIDVLRGAVDDARHGAALTIGGTLPPAPPLISAADRLTGDAGMADAAQRAMAALAGTAAAVIPGEPTPRLPYSGPELVQIATGLRSSADAATTFVGRRHATQAVVIALRDALSALERNLPASALASLDAANAPLALLDAWDGRPPLLTYWMTATRDLVAAARGIAAATIAGDEAAQRAAAKQYATASDAARGADNALAVTLSEEGGAVAGPALRRLAAAQAAATGARDGLQPLLHPAT